MCYRRRLCLSSSSRGSVAVSKTRRGKARVFRPKYLLAMAIMAAALATYGFAAQLKDSGRPQSLSGDGTSANGTDAGWRNDRIRRSRRRKLRKRPFRPTGSHAWR